MRTTRLGRCPAGKGITPVPVPRSAISSRGYNCVRFGTLPPLPPATEQEADPSLVASTYE